MLRYYNNIFPNQNFSQKKSISQTEIKVPSPKGAITASVALKGLATSTFSESTEIVALTSVWAKALWVNEKMKSEKTGIRNENIDFELSLKK